MFCKYEFDFSGGNRYTPPPNGGYGGYYPGGNSPGDYRSQLSQAQKSEKKALFKNASLLGALLLLYNFFNYVFIRAFYFLTYAKYTGSFSLNWETVKSYLREELLDVVTGSSYSMTANLFVVTLSLAALLITASAFMKIRIGSVLKPFGGCIKEGISWTPLCVTLNLIISLLVGIFVTIMGESGITVPEADFTVTSQSNYAVIIQIIYVCVIGPIAEEIIYRGFVIKLLSPYGKGLAIFFSAFIFGIMHGNIPQAASAFAGALIYAAIAVNFNSIAPTIIIHILNNCFASVTDIGDALNLSYAYEIYLGILIIIIFAGFYGIFVKLKPLTDKIRKEEPGCALPASKRYFTVFTNVLMLIYFMYILWEFVSSFIDYNGG